jgi:hypothetical protein
MQDPENSATLICGGTFSAITPDQRQTLDVTCPSGEAHHFNGLEINKCEQYANVLPTAVFDGTAGSTVALGTVSFRVYYPPLSGKLEDATPTVVEYFNCDIPKQPLPCENGLKDVGETDIDCGGQCGSTCPLGKGCLNDSDCLPGTACVPQMGLKTCAMAPTGAGGATASSSASGTGGA